MPAVAALNGGGPVQPAKDAPLGAPAEPAVSFSNGAEPNEMVAGVPAVTVTVCALPFDPPTGVVQEAFEKP
jgi:hypothetical protein